ncbi:kinase-like domain-containing protein [Phlebopus sp. FC_14]|nr:kinase-like domain-containing protein [Phlebopus sp. FC_14]
MDTDSLDALIGTVGQYLSVLTPAYGLVVKIWNTYDSVKTGRQRCGLVVRRAAWVLKTINDEMPKDGVEANAASLKALQQHMTDVLTIIQRQAEMSFFKALLRAGDINTAIEEAHRRLSDCLLCFQISLQREYFYHQIENQKEASRQADVAKLEELRKKAAGNYHETKRLLEINGESDEDEAMAAIQKRLNARADETAPETRLLRQSLDCLQVTTGRSAPKLSKWSITRHDLDLGETIGAGGFSTVKTAQYRKKTVAVKVLKDVSREVGDLDVIRILLMSRAVQALEREIEIWGNLRHDHIVPFYGAAILSSPPLMVSRYMRNGNLLQYLSARPQANRVKLVYEICLGMLYLHEENVIHGDLKAVNVLVDDSGSACITDFGLSKVKSPSPVTSRSGLGGTLRFMAPEAIKTGILTLETDVYAFGMIIYEIFTESVPFSSLPDKVVREGNLILERPTIKGCDRTWLGR